MRFIKWFLGILIAVILIVLIGGYIFLRTLDLNTYKPMIERIASEQLNRRLELKGDIYLGVSFIPTIIINDISLANPDWANNSEMVRASSIKIQVSLLPLLRKQVVVNEFKLVKPEIFIEVAKDGRASWDFDFSKSDESAKTVSGGWLVKSANAAELGDVSENDIRDILSDIVIREVSIENGHVVFHDHNAPEPMTVDINNFNFSMEGISNPINVVWDIIFNGMDCSGKGKFGSINALYDKNNPYPAEVKAKALGMTASVNAKVWDVMGSNLKAEFELEASNPSGNMGAPALNLNSTGNATLKVVNLNISKLDVAKNIIAGTVSADISGNLPYIKATLKSNLIDIQTLMPEQKTSYKLPGLISTAHASEFVPDEIIPFDLLKLVNADARVFVEKLIVNDDISANNVDLTAALKNGVLDIKPLTLSFGSGIVNINSTVNANAESLKLQVESEGIILQDFSKALIPVNENAFGIISGGKTHLSINVSGSGKTARRLVNNLSGPVIVIVDPSVVQSGNLKYFTNNIFSQILSLLKIDTTKHSKFDLKCAVVRADMENGVMNFPRGIAIDSNKLTVVSNGTINLNNDKLNLSLNAYGTGIADVSVTQALSSLLKISGTLQSPSVGIDTGGAVKTAASALLAGPVGIGANMLLDKDSAPCYTALQKTPFSNHFEKPKGAVAATQGAYQGTTGIIGDGVNAVTDSIGTGINAVSGSVGEGAESVKDTAKEAAKNIEKNVREVRDSLKNLLSK